MTDQELMKRALKRAGILPKRPPFRAWLARTYPEETMRDCSLPEIGSAEAATVVMRAVLKIETRAAIGYDEAAYLAFRRLEDGYYAAHPSEKPEGEL